jgi:protein HIRA/HIR1
LIFGKGKKDYMICALGSQDGSISLWSTIKEYSLLVIENLFDNTVYDIGWSSDGNTLWACSADGSVAYVHFNGSLGKAVSREKRLLMLEKYGYTKSRGASFPGTFFLI